MSTCPRVDEAVAYALHQLTSAEAAAFQEHMAFCAPCRLKRSEITETLDLLPLAVETIQPPAHLKENVLRSIAAESVAPKRDSRQRRLLSVWAVAASIFALGIGTYALVRTSSLQERLAGFQQAAPVEYSYSLAGVGDAPGAGGQVSVARAGSAGTRVTLQAHGLPPLKAGEVYQLWLVKNGKRTNGGVFVVDATGQGGLATWLPGNVEYDTVGVTREPDAFGTQPRGKKVMGSST